MAGLGGGAYKRSHQDSPRQAWAMLRVREDFVKPRPTEILFIFYSNQVRIMYFEVPYCSTVREDSQ